MADIAKREPQIPAPILPDFYAQMPKDLQEIYLNTPSNCVKSRDVGGGIFADYVPHEVARAILDAVVGRGKWDLKITNNPQPIKRTVEFKGVSSETYEWFLEGDIVTKKIDQIVVLSHGVGGMIVKKNHSLADAYKSAESLCIVNAVMRLGFFLDVYRKQVEALEQAEKAAETQKAAKTQTAADLNNRLAKVIEAEHSDPQEAARFVRDYILDDKTRVEKNREPWNILQKVKKDDGKLNCLWVVMTALQREITIKHFEKKTSGATEKEVKGGKPSTEPAVEEGT